jgi:hypothetical protein
VGLQNTLVTKTKALMLACTCKLSVYFTDLVWCIGKLENGSILQTLMAVLTDIV